MTSRKRWTPGKRWLGSRILRPQRTIAGLTLKRVAEVAGYDSVNELSYVELGYTAIIPEKVESVARAYGLDPTEFQLAWWLAKGIDDGLSPALIRLLFDRSELFGRGSGGAPPNMSEPPDSAGRPAVREDRRRSRSGPHVSLEEAVRDLLRSIEKHGGHGGKFSLAGEGGGSVIADRFSLIAANVLLWVELLGDMLH